MNSRNIFYRKIVYLALIGLLVLPLLWLGQPATDAVKGAQGKPGGKLAQLRKDYKLSQAQLGEVDPTSVTIKLATLGLRGVAATILWEKATEYQKQKDWTNLGATVNQITKVQPNFIEIWINQAWNLSYNCSVQFDDYRQRYRWVIKGFDFLKEGIKYNDREPKLQWSLGNNISKKIGKADEVKQYRRLFKEDDDFNAGVPVALRDNWLVGKKWYDDAVKLVDDGAKMSGQGPLIYRSSAPMCQMYYADAVEKDGTFGEVAHNAWATAAAEWRRFGSEDIPSSFTIGDNNKPVIVHLNDKEAEDAEAKRLIVQLDAMGPGLREKLAAEKKAQLTKQQKAAIAVPPEKRGDKEMQIVMVAEQAMQVTHDEVAHRIKGKQRAEAIRLAKEIGNHELMSRYINQYRDTVNFVSWRQRAEAEQTEELLTARRLISLGDRKYAEGDPVAARNAYRDGMNAWRKALDMHKEYITDQVNGEELMDTIKRYRRILNQLDEKFPEPFVLQDVIDANPEQPGAAPPAKDAKPSKPAK